MLRIIAVISLFTISLQAQQLSATTSDTLLCDPTVKLPKTYCLSCESWTDAFAPDFTGKIPIEYHLSIYNADHVEVFSTENINKGWDGTGREKNGNAQSFYWEMNYRYEKNGTLYRCNNELLLIQ